MPILNGKAFLDDVLSALAAQETETPWDFTAVDCGSTDGTLEIFERHSKSFPVPLKVHGIGPGEFNHGCTRNLLASLSTGEVIIFITDDAVPMSSTWLQTLLANYDDPQVSAAYCRNIAREKTDPVTKLLTVGDPSYASTRREVRLPSKQEYERMTPHHLRLLFNYTDTASSMRRDVWERHPYMRCSFGEDVLQSRAMLEAGRTVVFDSEACVEHSHEFGPEEARQRALPDAEFNVQWLGWTPLRARADVETLVERQRPDDEEALAQVFELQGEELRSYAQNLSDRRTQFLIGQWEAGRSLVRYGKTALLDSPLLTIVYLDEPGGSCADLAAAMAERGHRVESLATCPNDLAARIAHNRSSLIHAASPERLQSADFAALRKAGIAVWIDLTRAPDSHSADLCRAADMCRVPTRELRQALIEQHGFDPDRVLYTVSVPPAPGTRDKQLAELAGELEFRYRERLCRLFQHQGAWLGLRGTQCTSTKGSVEREDSEGLRLSATNCEVRYRPAWELERPGRARPETYQLRLWLAEALKAGDLSAGRIGFEGAEMVPFGPFSSSGRSERGGTDDLRLLCLSLPAGEPGAELVLCNTDSNGEQAFELRVRRLEFAAPGTPAPKYSPLFFDRCARHPERGSAAEEANGRSDATDQPADALLLSGAFAQAEYDLFGVPAGKCLFAIDIEGSGASGRLFVDGLPIGRFELAGGSRQILRVAHDSSRAPRSLRIETSDGSSPLSLYRVSVRDADDNAALARVVGRRVAPKLRALLGRPKVMKP